MDLNGDGKFDGRDYLLHEEFYGNNEKEKGSNAYNNPGCWILLIPVLLVLTIIDIILKIFS